MENIKLMIVIDKFFVFCLYEVERLLYIKQSYAKVFFFQLDCLSRRVIDTDFEPFIYMLMNNYCMIYVKHVSGDVFLYVMTELHRFQLDWLMILAADPNPNPETTYEDTILHFS